MNRTEKIQKYLDSRMSEVELLEFKEQLKIDPDLVAELDIHRLTKDVVRDGDEDRFRKKLSEAYENYSDKRHISNKQIIETKTNKFLLRFIPLVAAVIAVLFFLLNPLTSTPEKLYSKYYETFLEDYSSRSVALGDESFFLEEAVKLYLTNNYVEALSSLIEYSSDRKDISVISDFYMGLTQIENENFEKAEESFLVVLNQDFNFLQEHSQWYLSLVYLKVGKNNLAEENLLEIKYQESGYSKRAKEILKRLPN